MTEHTRSAWPWLREYEGEQLRRISMPLGGIGTGTIGLTGRGCLDDWETSDHPARGHRPGIAFFAIRVAEPGGETLDARALEGPIDSSDYDGPFGSRAQNHGLPRFRSAVFRSAYPLATVELVDDLPVDVVLEAFNPLVPGDVEASSQPMAMLRYRVRNTATRPLDVTVAGNLSTPFGGGTTAARRIRTPEIVGIELATSGGPAHEAGSLALSAVRPVGAVTDRTAWPRTGWGDRLQEFWDDFTGDGALTEPDPSTPATEAVASLAETVRIDAGAEHAFTFLVTWHTALRRAWEWVPLEWGDTWRYDDDVLLQNHYAIGANGAGDVAEALAPRLAELERRTVGFVREFVDQDVPAPLLEAALFTASTLRSQTCFRTADGNFFGWEGVGDTVGSCHGNCTHVWHYEYATMHLFGELSRSMRSLEFLHATDERGLMSFRIGLPLETKAREWPLAAADGQMGALVRLFHDWRASGDDEFLARLWPSARRSLEFCWIPGGWDADQDGVMEGVQHNTYDIEFFGPNPQSAGWYLAALDAASRMADRMGEGEFAERCRRLLASGSRHVDDELFNGEYHVQQVLPVEDPAAVAEGLRHPSNGARDLEDPPFQLGEGCLIDQHVGQVASALAGLGTQWNPEHLASSADAVFRHNWRDGFDRTLNFSRSYALGTEAGLVISSYPRGGRPARPFPYATEVMTGFEYTAATALVQAGREDAALQVVAAIRDRFDGSRRNPFDEMEAGRHYARAMASWGTLVAWTGVRHDAVDGVFTLRPRNGRARYSWSTGDAWGTVTVAGDGSLRLEAREGSIRVREVRAGDWGTVRFVEVAVTDGRPLVVARPTAPA